MQKVGRRVGVSIAVAALLLLGWRLEAHSLQHDVGHEAFDLAAKPPLGSRAIPRPEAKSGSPAAGKLLVATPQVNGPFFAQSVVLLLDYDEKGAIGLIVNQKTSVSIQDLIPEVAGIEKRTDPVYLGGPVSLSSIAFLIRADGQLPESRRVIDEIHLSGSPRALEHAIESKTPASRFHVFVGYAGWGAGQLEGEIARGDWWVAPGEAALVFDEEPDALWRKLFFRHGGVQVRNRDVGLRLGAG